MNLIEVETIELSGPALDWAVLEAEGAPCFVMGDAWPGNSVVDEAAYGGRVLILNQFGNLIVVDRGWRGEWSPSTNWAQGGPLIDKYCSEVSSRTDFPFADGPWGASVTSDPDVFWVAPTPLVAVCRAVVARKLGRAVKVPAMLVEVAHG